MEAGASAWGCIDCRFGWHTNTCGMMACQMSSPLVSCWLLITIYGLPSKLFMVCIMPKTDYRMEFLCTQIVSQMAYKVLQLMRSMKLYMRLDSLCSPGAAMQPMQCNAPKIECARNWRRERARACVQRAIAAAKHQQSLHKCN